MTMPAADVQVMAQLLGTLQQLGFANRHVFGIGTPNACPAMDPLRGVGCALIFGHKGDHESIGGFPFSRTKLDPSEKPSEADLAAARSMLSEAGITPDWDAHPARSAKDIAMEACYEHEECDMEPCTKGD